MSTNLFVVFAILLIGAQARYVIYEIPDTYLETPFGNIPEEEEHSIRVRRQAHGSVSTNPDGSPNLNIKVPIVGNDKNVLSAIGSVAGKQGSGSGGLLLENVNGHSLAATAKHIPGFGDQLTGAAKLNLLNTGDHKLNANAFVTKNMPTIPQVPNFNTHGGSVDYLFKDKVGASFGAAQTPFLQRTDLSAMGNVNLFRNPSSSLDLNAGYTKTLSPFINNDHWKPSAGLSFTRFW